MTESKPDQSASPEHADDDLDTTTHPVSREPEVSAPGSDPAAGSNGEHAPAAAAANGHSEGEAPWLPPPWERAPNAAPASSGSASTDPASTDPKPKPAEDATSAAARPAAAERGGDGTGRDVEHGSVPGTPIGRGSTDLGDARTIAVDPRVGAGLGGLGGGFGADRGDGLGGAAFETGTPAGSSAAAPSFAGGGTPGGFPAAWPRNRRPRQANLQLKRLDPWSVLKIALVLSVVLYLVWMVAVGVLYGALDGIGVWERLNGQYADLVAEHAGDKLISAGRIFGFAAVVGAVNSLLVAVAFSVSAFIYNVSADMVGGIEVTLSERD